MLLRLGESINSHWGRFRRAAPAHRGYDLVNQSGLWFEGGERQEKKNVVDKRIENCAQ